MVSLIANHDSKFAFWLCYLLNDILLYGIGG